MKRLKKRAIVWPILIFALCVMIFSGYKLRKIQRMYTEGDQNYKELKDLVQLTPHDSGYGARIPSENPAEVQVEMSGRYIDFDVLKEINDDAVAWLYCPDTVIDYPVMQADDYDWYLNHLPDGTTNDNGTLFLDYHCPADFAGRLSIIYGHNMRSGKMFGTLMEYKQQAYFDEHLAMYLYTAENGSYRVDLLYGFAISAEQWQEQAFMYEANLDVLLAYADNNSTFASDVTYGADDRFVVLSTCSYEFDDARYVVIGVLRPECGID